MARAASREVIGAATCPLCSGKTELRLSGSGLAYMVTSCCQAQIFSRGVRSDAALRRLVTGKPAEPAPAEPPPPPAPAAKPANPAPAEPTKPAKQSPSWGIGAFG